MRGPGATGWRRLTRPDVWASLAAAALCFVLSPALPATAQAQWVSPTGWHRFSLGVGPAEAWSRALPERRDGAAVMAAFELVAREHWEVRFSGTLFEGSGRAETQLGGAAIDAVVFPVRRRVQPYVGAGIGVYQLLVEDADPAAAERRRDAKGPAWTALAGARVRVGALTPFVEWRRTEFGPEVAVERYAPLIFGLHF